VNSKITLGLVGVLLIGISSSGQQRTEPAEGIRLIDSIQGAELFRAYCAVCHGRDGKGEGPMAGSLKATPPDLTRIAARNAGLFPLVRVQKIISGEESTRAGHGTREMPVWGPIFSVVAGSLEKKKLRIYNLAKYIEELQAK